MQQGGMLEASGQLMPAVDAERAEKTCQNVRLGVDMCCCTGGGNGIGIKPSPQSGAGYAGKRAGRGGQVVRCVAAKLYQEEGTHKFLQL